MNTPHSLPPSSILVISDRGRIECKLRQRINRAVPLSAFLRTFPRQSVPRCLDGQKPDVQEE